MIVSMELCPEIRSNSVSVDLVGCKVEIIINDRNMSPHSDLRLRINLKSLMVNRKSTVCRHSYFGLCRSVSQWGTAVSGR